MLVWHGPEHLPLLYVLAPGDAGRLTDAAPTLIAEGLARAGVRVVRFPYPDDGGDDDAVRDALLAAAIGEAAASRRAHQRLVLWSRGRIWTY